MATQKAQLCKPAFEHLSPEKREEEILEAIHSIRDYYEFKFINAKSSNQIVFTNNTTDSLNQIVFGYFKHKLNKSLNTLSLLSIIITIIFIVPVNSNAKK